MIFGLLMVLNLVVCSYGVAQEKGLIILAQSCQSGTTPCGDGCCPAGETCCGNGCCPGGSTCCGDGCCPAGGTCYGNSVCCLAGKTPCGDGCCLAGETCCGNHKCCKAGTTCYNGECMAPGKPAYPANCGKVNPNKPTPITTDLCPGGLVGMTYFCGGNTGCPYVCCPKGSPYLNDCDCKCYPTSDFDCHSYTPCKEQQKQ
jgi:hypothetical protein